MPFLAWLETWNFRNPPRLSNFARFFFFSPHFWGLRVWKMSEKSVLLSQYIYFHVKMLWERENAKSLQSCPTLCDPIDGSPPGFPIPGILQARTLEWVAISFSNAWKWKVKVKSLSHIRLLVTHGLQPTRLLCPWDFPGKSTGVGCHCLLRKERIEIQIY